MTMNFLACPLTLNMDTSDYIAALAALVAIISYVRSERLTKAGFNRNFRPYIFAESHFQIRKSEVREVRAQMLSVMIITGMNAPAYIKSATTAYYLREAGKPDKLYYEFKELEKTILYPLADIHPKLYADPKKINMKTLAEFNVQVIRKLRIDYGWISDNDDINYFFEGEWNYNVNYKIWELINQNAN